MDDKRYKLLVVDDEQAILQSYEAILNRFASPQSGLALKELEAELFATPAEAAPALFDITARRQGAEAVEVIKRTVGLPKNDRYSVVFMDARMPPGINGVEAARQIHEIDPDVIIVFVTGYSDVSILEIAAKFPPSTGLYLVPKPFDGDDICNLAQIISKKWDNNGHVSDDENSIIKKFKMFQIDAA